MSIVCVIFLVSCAPASDVDGPSLPVLTDDETIATLPPPVEGEAMTSIQAAFRRESDMNPLYPKHYATRSLFALVYEPLFKVDHEGRIVPVLAKSIAYDDATTCRIEICDGKTFHGGKKLTALDVKASLLKTISLMTAGLKNDNQTGIDHDTGNKRSKKRSDSDNLSVSYKDGSQFQESPFSLMAAAKRNDYLNIRQVTTEGTDVVILELNKPDPRITELLTFPVIPQSHVNVRSTNPVPGSGAWRLVSTERGRHMVLERVESGAGIRQISAKAYDNASQAMAAFDKGEIDVLVLDASETSIYADRTRIRKQRIDYPGYISLFFREKDRESALLSRDYMMSEIRADSRGDLFAAPFIRSFYPLLSGDFRLRNVSVPEYSIGDLPVINRPDNEPELIETTDDTGAPAPSAPDTREPFVLLVPEGFAPYRLVENIGACASRLGRRFVPVHVSKSDWPEKLRKGSYDAALLVDTTNIFPDPADYLDSLKFFGLFDWTEHVDTEDVATLREARLLASASVSSALELFSDTVYAQTVSNVFSVLPVFGLAIPETMVLYGSNVDNTMSGIWYSPYENVEELIVWRP